MKKINKITALVVVAVLISLSSQTVNAETYDQNLTLGSTGVQVEQLQTWLESNGYLVMPGGAAKGFFGSRTKIALANLQKSIGFPSTGFFGPMTRGYLNNMGMNSSLNVIFPNGGETWQLGSYQTIKWNAPKYFKATTVDIHIRSNNPNCQPCPAGSVCTINVCALSPTYEIANNVNAEQKAYIWRVGEYRPITAPNAGVSPSLAAMIDGQYLITICESGTNVCATSKKPFTITSQVVDSRAPVIKSLNAPTSLKVGQTGTWVLNATDPQGGTLVYSINSWGDEDLHDSLGMPLVPSYPPIQTSTFTHSYSKVGTYKITFTVRNSLGLSVDTSTTVQINPNSETSTIKVISPKGGEYWVTNSVHQIVWTNTNTAYDSKVDLYLVPVVACPLIYPAPASCYPPTITLDRNISTSAVYNWIVGTDIVNNPISAGSYQVKICVAGTTNCATSEREFNIIAPTTVTSSSTSLRICPNRKIINMMPIVGTSSVPNTYYILNGQRRELTEFDQNWVGANCTVPQETVM